MEASAQLVGWIARPILIVFRRLPASVQRLVRSRAPLTLLGVAAILSALAIAEAAYRAAGIPTLGGISSALAVPAAISALASAAWFWWNYRQLNALLCIDDWHFDQQTAENARKHLSSVKRSMQVMCFGFGKYANTLDAQPRAGDSDHLAVVAKRVAEDGGSLQVLTMHPFSEDMAAYTAASSQNEQEQQARERRRKMIRDLRNLSRVNDDLGSEIVQVRTYAKSDMPQTSFRMFMADGEQIFLSVYQTRYRRKEADERINEIVIKRPKTSAEHEDFNRSLFSGFRRLFQYQWEIARPMQFRTVSIELKTSQLTPVDIDRVRSAIDDYCQAVREKTLADFLSDGRVVAAAVAGKDSMATIARAIERDGIELVVPIVVVVPTEVGQEQVRLETLGALRRVLDKAGRDKLAPAVVLYDDRGIWRYVNQNFADYSEAIIPAPCAGCHVYLHLVRSMLASRLGISTVISGDRERHGEKIKLNQTLDVLNTLIAESKSRYGVDLQFPLRKVADDQEVWAHLFRFGIRPEQMRDTTCLFSGKGVIQSDPARLARGKAYVSEVVVPFYDQATKGIQSALAGTK
jgi:hypothetical protein